MATVYNLLASACPAPQVPAALLSIAGEVPTTFTALVAAASGSGSLVSKANKNAVRSDNIGRAGGGAYAIDWDSGPSSSVPGLQLTTTGALNVTVGTGQAMIDGPVQITTPTTVSGIVDASTIYVWLNQAGVPVVAIGSLTPPSGGLVFLGRVVTAAGVVSAIDGSGVMYLRGPHLLRRTADTGCPTDTPPSGLSFFNKTDGGLFFWDGEGWQNLTNAGRSNLTFSSDANKTLTAAEYSNQFIEFGSGGTALTATRDVVMPLTPQGRWWDVKNGSNGGQSLRFIGASGTGITVATGKVARIAADGTNIIRLTADL